MEEFRKALLKDDLDLYEAKKLQIKYKSIFKNLESKEEISLSNIINIAAVDISYLKKENEEHGISCAVLWNIKNKRVNSSVFCEDQIRFPYRPGFLGFRECHLLAEAINKLVEKPDVIMCDGHGIIHPKRFGEAVQLGFALNVPSIGIAKNPFIGFYKWKSLEKKRGNKQPILTSKPKFINIKKPELLGYAVCLNDNMRPVFISEGYGVNLDLAIELALQTTLNHRQPEPLYLADQLSKRKAREIFKT
ncbi:MAG: endonuclease V [Promethearchaeota archaeon]